MSVEIEGIRETKTTFKALQSFFSSKVPMENITVDVMKHIETRTGAGKDYKNRKFKPYSAAYKKKTGKTKVDLRDTGEMLDALEGKALTPTHGRISIEGRRQIIAQIHTTGTGKQPQREFMNITDNAISKIVKKHYDDKIMKILGRG